MPFGLRQTRHLTWGTVYLLLSGRQRYGRVEGVWQCTYGHIVFRSKIFDCWDGVARDPDNRYASVLELDFL